MMRLFGQIGKVCTMYLPLAILSSLIALAACTPDEIRGRVVRVIDGDSLTVAIDGRHACHQAGVLGRVQPQPRSNATRYLIRMSCS